MIRSLRILVYLIETQSFTETAKRSYLTQSAISQHIKSLEEKLGHRLLERRKGHITLTAQGRLVYDAAQDILWRYQRLERALERPPKEVSGIVRVSASLIVGMYELPSYIAQFLRHYPNVDLKLAYLRPIEVYEAVISDNADVGIVAFPVFHPKITTRHFQRDRFVAIISPSHPWASLKRIGLKKLNGQPFIAMQAGSPTREVIDRLLKKAHAQVNIAYEFDNFELIKRSVEVGSGISIVPQKAATNEIQAGALKQLDLFGVNAEYPVGILMQKHAKLSVQAQKFVDTLLSRDHRPSAA